MDLPDDSAARFLLEEGRRSYGENWQPIIFTDSAEAELLVKDLEGHPHAYVIACLLDRQIKSERAWRIPYEFALKLGDFRFETLAALSEERIREILIEQKLHRYPEMMARNFHAAIARIAREYKGNAARIWNDRPSSARLVRRFLEFPGIGPKIATMAANLREKERSRLRPPDPLSAQTGQAQR